MRGPGRAVTVVSSIALGTLTVVTLAIVVVQEPRTMVMLDVAVAVAAIILAPLMLRWPLAGGLALSVLAALSPVATPAATASALQTARMRRFPVAVLAAIVGIAAHAFLGWWRPTGGLSYWWWLLLISVAYAALIGWGALAQARTALLISLHERAVRAEAEQEHRVIEARLAERTRIAREMHDVLAHRLSLLATYAGALEYRPDAPPERLAAAAGVVREGVHQALNELRQVVTLLREDDGESDRPMPTLADIPSLIGESVKAGMKVRFVDRVKEPAGLPAATGRTAYRIVQESLTNARKHAAGQPVTVELGGQAGDRLMIEVTNPLLTLTEPGPGMGLIGLAERVQLAGGQLRHEITNARVFRIHAWLPWPQ